MCVLNPHVHVLSDDAAVIAYTTLTQHLDKLVGYYVTGTSISCSSISSSSSRVSEAKQDHPGIVMYTSGSVQDGFRDGGAAFVVKCDRGSPKLSTVQTGEVVFSRQSLRRNVRTWAWC